MIDPRALSTIQPHPKPVVQLTVDGLSLDGVIRKRLIQLTHTDNRGFETDTVELELDDSDGAIDLPPRGAILAVAFGWDASGVVNKGTYTVDEIDHRGAPDVLTIRARSADLRTGLTTQRERSWPDTTLGAIIRTIAAENDLKPVITVGLSEIAIEHIDQTNESAVNLLTRLAQQYDAIATVKENRLLFMPVGGGRSASGKRIPGVTIVRSSGDNHQFNLADRQTYSAVRATYNDLGKAVKGEVIWDKEGEATERQKPIKAAPVPPAGQYKDAGKTFKSRDTAQRAAAKQWAKLKTNKAQRAAYIGVKAKYDDRNLHVSGEVTHGQADDEKKLKSAKKLEKSDAEKTNPHPEPINAFEHSADNLKTLRHVYASKANAQHAARAEWNRLQRGMATFSITLAMGDPKLFPETPATVSGWKPQIDSTDWIITRVTNTLSDSGYGQRLELEIKATEIRD